MAQLILSGCPEAVEQHLWYSWFLSPAKLAAHLSSHFSPVATIGVIPESSPGQ